MHGGGHEAWDMSGNSSSRAAAVAGVGCGACGRAASSNGEGMLSGSRWLFFPPTTRLLSTQNTITGPGGR